MVGGPAMGDQQSQEGGYNASLKNKAEAAARGETLAVGGAANLLHPPLSLLWLVCQQDWGGGLSRFVCPHIGVGRRDADRGRRRSRVDGGRPADVVGAAAAGKSSCSRTSTECTVHLLPSCLRQGKRNLILEFDPLHSGFVWLDLTWI